MDLFFVTAPLECVLFATFIVLLFYFFTLLELDSPP